MNHTKLFKLGAALAAAVSISACVPGIDGLGGGGSEGAEGFEGNEGYEGNSGGGGFGAGVLLANVTATPTTVAAGTSFNASWNVGVTEIASFTVNLYVSPTTSKLAGTQVYTANAQAMFPGSTGTATCSYDAAGSLTCGANLPVDLSAMVTTAAGNVNLVAEVCQFATCGMTVSTPLTLAVPAGAAAPAGRTYTDPGADEVGGAGTATHIDLTTLAVTSDATTVSADITVTGPLPTVALNLNQGNVLNGELEMAWGVQFDIDNDGTSANDIALVYGHRQNDVTGPTTGAIGGAAFAAELLTFDALGNATVSATDVLTATVAGNTITISGTNTTAPSLVAITGAATPVAVRFDSNHDTNSDAHPNAGGLSNYVN